MAKILRVGVVTYEQLEQGIIPKHVTVDSIFYVAEYFKLKPADLFKVYKIKAHYSLPAGIKHLISTTDCKLRRFIERNLRELVAWGSRGLAPTAVFVYFLQQHKK